MTVPDPPADPNRLLTVDDLEELYAARLDDDRTLELDDGIPIVSLRREDFTARSHSR